MKIIGTIDGSCAGVDAMPIRLYIAMHIMAQLAQRESGTFDTDARSALHAADALIIAYNRHIPGKAQEAVVDGEPLPKIEG